MPSLDMSRAVLNPAFQDQLVCIRAAESVNTGGEDSDATQQIPFFGVVTQESGIKIVRTPDAQYNDQYVVVTTTFKLRDAGANNDADQVVWNNRTYTVVSLLDYSTYGAGFSSARCELVSVEGDAQ